MINNEESSFSENVENEQSAPLLNGQQQTSNYSSDNTEIDKDTSYITTIKVRTLLTTIV